MEEIWREIEGISVEKSLHMEVSALFYANKMDVDVSRYIDDVRNFLEIEGAKE